MIVTTRPARNSLPLWEGESALRSTSLIWFYKYRTIKTMQPVGAPAWPTELRQCCRSFGKVKGRAGGQENEVITIERPREQKWDGP